MRNLPRVIVIGGGIVGSSLAYQLARCGAQTTLLERGELADDVTGKAFGWLNVSAHDHDALLSPLKEEGLREYRLLNQSLDGALPIDWCGAVVWRAGSDETEGFVRAHADAGYDIRLVTRDEIARLESHLRDPPRCAAHAPGEGTIDPALATRVFARAARDFGAEIRTGNEVLALVTSDSGVTGVRTPSGVISADVVVLAAGTASPALAATVGLTLSVTASPCLLVRYNSTDRLFNGVVQNPGLEARQAGDGSILSTEAFIAGSGKRGPEAVAREGLASIKGAVTADAEIELARVDVGIRPMPEGGIPIVGFAPNIAGLYTAVMHAGVTLGPITTRLASMEIIEGVETPALARLRSARSH